ncbi:MAG: T9SS type A sorting domain-containing protein [Bacteroidota bacterium]
MKHSYLSQLLAALVLLFMGSTVMAQSTLGPIQITSFADSTSMMAGDNFPQALMLDSTYNIQGSYGNFGNAQTVRITYDIFNDTWTGTDYSNAWIIADDTTGTLDGSIDYDFTIPADAALTADFPGGFAIIQARVFYDPDEETFWNIFIEVVDGAATAVSAPPIQGLKAFPNPIVAGHFYVETPQGLPKEIRIFDLSGREVINQHLMSNGKISVQELNAGIYIARIVENGAQSIVKLEVQ